MKKLFFFATVICAAVSMNAETIYDFSTMAFADADLTVTNGTKTYNESKSYYEIKNTAGETVVLEIATLPNVQFSYKNSDVKTAFKVAPNKYIQFDGDQRDLTINNLSVGDIVTLSVASKGSTANSFEDSENKGTGLTGCVWVSGNKTQAAKDGEMVYEEIQIQAIATTIVLRTTAGGYALNKIVISSSANGIENTVFAPKATKMMVDGQMIIVRDGVKYNALGTVVE